ncbi:hypothetical protein CTheo_3652 [Ceratobasidium theobromae]|uniref:Uncharacterized protein n=1 Tax=Ceratobasidium theobromae TaxID=1582974 RepID=A0A5N5QN40_9AGAM|nr:hypothetical protein CTheo_3652 [Ceratobasidium theobromae]
MFQTQFPDSRLNPTEYPPPITRPVQSPDPILDPILDPDLAAQGRIFLPQEGPSLLPQRFSLPSAALTSTSSPAYLPGN